MARKKQLRHIGKHSLKSDNIFHSSKSDNEDNRENEYINEYVHDSFSINDELMYNKEEDDLRQIEMKKQIRHLMEKFTEVKLHDKIRKPAKSDFNAYFQLCLNELKEHGYAHYEIFLELAGYFTKDSYWNIFKLLDKNYGDIITNELKQKYGFDELDELDVV